MTFKVVQPDEVTRPKRYVNRVFIHCTATDNEGPAYNGSALAKTIDGWHKQRGWTGVGYHWVIDKQGNISTGRNPELTPSAQAGNNAGTLAICCHGLSKEKFTDVQLQALKELCEHINKLYSGKITFHGHCEVSPKTCPVFNYKKVLNLDEHGSM